MARQRVVFPAAAALARRAHAEPMPRPWLRVRYTPQCTTVHLTVQVGPGKFQTFTTCVDNAMVRRTLERYGVEVGFSLGGIWKAVKKVAKVTGISSVLHSASKALSNPLISAVLPVAPLAGQALKVASGLVGAKLAAERGDPRAKKLVQRSAELARQAPGPQRDGHDMAQRIYRIVVSPA